jgi:transposase
VPAFLTHREPKRNPSKGKSDPSDAVAIARVTARGEGLSSPPRNDVFVDLKLLSDHRDQLVRARTRPDQPHPHRSRDLPPGLREEDSQAQLEEEPGRSPDAGARGPLGAANLIRDRIGEIRRLNKKVADVDGQIAGKVKESGTTLTSLRGCRGLADGASAGSLRSTWRRWPPSYLQCGGSALWFSLGAGPRVVRASVAASRSSNWHQGASH